MRNGCPALCICIIIWHVLTVCRPDSALSGWLKPSTHVRRRPPPNFHHPPVTSNAASNPSRVSARQRVFPGAFVGRIINPTPFQKHRQPTASGPSATPEPVISGHSLPHLTLPSAFCHRGLLDDSERLIPLNPLSGCGNVSVDCSATKQNEVKMAASLSLTEAQVELIRYTSLPSLRNALRR